jgi:hypothetical protein
LESTCFRASPTAWKYQSAEEMKSSAMVHFGKVKVLKLYLSVFFCSGRYVRRGWISSESSLPQKCKDPQQ